MTLGVPTNRILGDWPVGAKPSRLPTPEERARAQDEFYRQTRGEQMPNWFEPWRGLPKAMLLYAVLSAIGAVVLAAFHLMGL